MTFCFRPTQAKPDAHGCMQLRQDASPRLPINGRCFEGLGPSRDGAAAPVRFAGQTRASPGLPPWWPHLRTNRSWCKLIDTIFDCMMMSTSDRADFEVSPISHVPGVCAGVRARQRSESNHGEDYAHVFTRPDSRIDVRFPGQHRRRPVSGDFTAPLR
jgi:hypothetical protein